MGQIPPLSLVFAAPFAIAGILLFTTPQASETQRLVWAYVTYILMMTVYTGINVPYGSMLGVISNDSDEKTVFSSFRMFFAYGARSSPSLPGNRCASSSRHRARQCRGPGSGP
jgi:GPH family glycoside/pentoside/hexuronide:cation symporter